MESSTSLFSSEIKAIQTGGASAMTIIMILICCCCIFCIALLGVNKWKIDFVFKEGPTVGLMFAMLSIMSALIMFLAYSGGAGTSEGVFSYRQMMNPESGPNIIQGMGSLFPSNVRRN